MNDPTRMRYRTTGGPGWLSDSGFRGFCSLQREGWRSGTLHVLTNSRRFSQLSTASAIEIRADCQSVNCLIAGSVPAAGSSTDAIGPVLTHGKTADLPRLGRFDGCPGTLSRGDGPCGHDPDGAEVLVTWTNQRPPSR